VEAIVCKTLGDVGNFNSGGLLEGTNVEDELVGAAAVGVGVDNLVVGEETGHDVVGVEEGGTSLLGKTISTHHEDVGVADGENRGATPGSGADGSNGCAVTFGTNALRINLRVTGEVRSKMLLNSDRANTGTTAAVGNTEGLVEVEMADISTNVTGAAKTDLGVHVGTVHVDETAMLVDKITDLLDLRLEDTESRGIGNHDSSKLISVLDTLGLQILDIQVTSLTVTLDSNNLHTSHGSRSRVGTVSRNRDKADLSLISITSLVVSLDTAKTSKLTLCTRVGLKSGSVHTSDLRQVFGERADESLVTRSLLNGGEGVDVVDTRVGNRKHLGCGVELHCAGAKRNHGVNEGDILGLEVVDVSKELGLGVVLVEDRLLEVAGLSLERSRDLVIEEGSLIRRKSRLELGLRNAKGLNEVTEALKGDTLVKREANLVLSNTAKVNVLRLSVLVNLGNGLRRSLESDSIEKNRTILAETLSVKLELALLKDQALSKTGLAPDILSNGLETLRTMVDSVESRHVGKKSLSSADIAGGLLTTNVLLTSLESQAKSRLAETILGNTNETTRNLALVLLRCSEESSMGTTVTERNTEALGVTDGDVGAKFSRGLEHGKSEKIGGCAEKSLLLVDDVGESLVIVNTTVGIGVLNQGSNEVAFDFANELGVVGEDIADDELDAESLSSGLEDGDGLGVAVLGDDKDLLAFALGCVGHRHGHGLSSGGSLIENRGVGDVETSQICDESLEVEERLKTALADLSLVGGVAGIPGRVLEHIALDNSRNKSSIVTSTNERFVDLVVLGKFSHLLLDVVLSTTIGGNSSFLAALIPLFNEVETLLFPPNLRGNSLLEKLLHGAHGRVQHLEHFCLLAGLAANVPP
jgi:hypothetical protein